MSKLMHSISKGDFTKLNKVKFSTDYSAPRYISTFLNNVNQYARSTRKETVGKLATTVFPEYLSQTSDPSPENWKSYYLNNYQSNYEDAIQKLLSKFLEVKKAICDLTEEQIKAWLDDLMFYKTFNGLYVQEAILQDIASKTGSSYIKSTAEEEGQGIDGFINGVAYSIKPETYKDTLANEKETIKAKVVFYKYIFEKDSDTKIEKVEYYIEDWNI